MYFLQSTPLPALTWLIQPMEWLAMIWRPWTLDHWTLWLPSPVSLDTFWLLVILWQRSVGLMEGGVGLVQCCVNVSPFSVDIVNAITTFAVAVICPDLPVPTNGAPFVYSDTTIPRAEGSTATYTCNTGYQVTGLMMRTCTVSGWSTGDDPVCTGEGDECICANSVLIVRPSQPPVLSSPSPMEWSATVQLPPPYSREPWLHTAVLSLGTNCPHPHLLGPVSLTEHGVEMTSLVKVSCIDLLIILHTMMLIVSCGLWQSSGDLKWNTPIFCNYIWRDCHLHVQWNLCSIRKLHYLHV